jgi:hypothetical protein
MKVTTHCFMFLSCLHFVRLLTNIYSQPCTSPRTPAGTLDAIINQLLTAALGVQGNVEELQTETGIKDKITQFWIGELLTRARALQTERVTHNMTKDSRLKNRKLKGQARKDVVEEIKYEIRDELLVWLLKQPAAEWDALPQEAQSALKDDMVFDAAILRRLLRPGTHYNVLLATRCTFCFSGIIIGMAHRLWYQC